MSVSMLCRAFQVFPRALSQELYADDIAMGKVSRGADSGYDFRNQVVTTS